MRIIFFIIAPLILTNCTYEKVFLNDVDKLVSNQMENNRIEINRIKREIKAFKIEKLDKNISLINGLDNLHEDISRLNKIIDSVDQDVALRLAIAFRNTHFQDLDSFNEVPLELNSATPKPLFKLHFSTLEAFLNAIATHATAVQTHCDTEATGKSPIPLQRSYPRCPNLT